MTKRRQQQKQGHLGPAFHAYLEWLEYVESVLVSGKQPNRRKHLAMNDRLFHVEDEKMMASVMNETLPVDAYLARVVRSSVKYKMDFKTVLDISQRYQNEINYIRKNYQMRLPHEWCTVIIEGIGPDDFILVGQEQTSDEEYDPLGIGAGEEFICTNMAFYRHDGVELLPDSEQGFAGGVATGQKLSYCPVELHMRLGQTTINNTFLHAVPEHVEVTGPGKTAVDLARECFLIWLNQFELQSILRNKKAGVAPSPGNGYQRRKLRKKHEHPQFEHTIIQLEVDAPDSSQTGRSMFQPRKRLHQVRGFWRHYKKTGKKVWVKPHWRGDEHLGVIKRDFELVTHEEQANG